MARNPWVWAGQCLWRNAPLVAIGLLLNALLITAMESTPMYFVVFFPLLLVLFVLLEFRFFVLALKQHGEAPARLWSLSLIFGFVWRWGAVLLIFGLLPMIAVMTVIFFGAPSYPEAETGRVFALVAANFWLVGYAAMGSILPAYLSGRPGGIGDAITRPGFGRRLRLLAPAGLVYLIATFASNELLESFPDFLGGVAQPLLSDVALLNMGLDLMLFYALAVVVRMLTDHLLAEEKLSGETARVFE